MKQDLNTSVVRKDAPNLDYWHWRFFYGRSISAFAPKPGDIEALYATLAGQGNSPALFNIIFGNNGAYRIVRFGDLSAAATVLSGKLSQPASGGGLSLLIKPSNDGAIPSPGQQFRLSVLPTSAVADMIVNKGVLSVTADGTLETPTKIANLEMLWGNPYQGMRFVNQLMEDFIASQLSWTTESASATEQYLAQQLKNVRLSLAKANYDLATYQSQTGDLDVSENVQAMIKELSQYEVQRTNLQLQQQALEKLSNEMADTSHSLNPFIVSQTNDLVLGQLANSLANAEALLQAHRVQFTSELTDVKVQEATIANIEGSIRTLVSNDLILAQDSLKTINSLIDNYQQKLKGIPEQSLRITELSRASDVYGQLYILLMQKKEEAEVSKATTIVNTRVVAPAELPFGASQPKAMRTVSTGFAIGGLFGILLVIGQHLLSDRFESKEDIYRSISAPIYALVPRRSTRDMSSGVFSKWNRDAFSEAFRLLRSRVYQSASNQGSQVILITSANVGDGNNHRN